MPPAAPESFLRRAIELAVTNVRSGRGGPFGAVIARNGEILAEGVNLVTATHDPTAHAEVVAIREAARRLSTHDLGGCEIYASCEPCPMCLGAIYWARCGALYFAASRQDAAAAGFSDDLIYREIPLDAARRSVATCRLLVAEGAEPFALWARSATKIPY